MDWWKGKAATNHDLLGKSAKSNESKKTSKPRNKADTVSSIGQSTILSFVENKDDKTNVLESSPNGQDGVLEISCKSNPHEFQGESSAVCNQSPDSPVPSKSLIDTPLISRVSIKDFTLSADPSDTTENTKPKGIVDGSLSESSPLAEPTRRSARLKSIQVKQALKDESTWDDAEDDFQPKKPRSVSKGKLFFLSKEEKERLREEEELRLKQEEEERQRERERQQCERLREEIRKAKEENLQRSLGRQTNPFLLPRAVPSSLSIVIDDEEPPKSNLFTWEEDHDGSLCPFPLITHVTQIIPEINRRSENVQETSPRHHGYQLLIASSGCHSFVQKQIQAYLDMDTSQSVKACTHQEQNCLTSFTLTRQQSNPETKCDHRSNTSIDKTSIQSLSHCRVSPNIETGQVSVEPSAHKLRTDEAADDQHLLNAIARSLEERCGRDTSEVMAMFDRLRHRRLAEDGRKLWADLYRPRHGNEICGNQDKVKLLRRCLIESEKDSSNKRHKQSSKKRKDSDDDEDYDDDLEDSSCQAILISGPPGCGKSAAIYALAEELKLQVLEINSSDKRCGRLVLDKVGEATRSQSLLKRASGEDICQVSARNENANSGKRKKGLSKDDFESQMLVSKEPAVETGPTAALILFEEVDVLLDHDKGFLAAVIALVEQTCVPIVMTCQQKPSMMEGLGLREIVWKSPDWKDALLNLSAIATLEGSEPVLEDIHRTYTILNYDFRRTLMMLQLASVKPCPSTVTTIKNEFSITGSSAEHSQRSDIRLMPSPVAIARGFYSSGAIESSSHFLDGKGVNWILTPKGSSMAERYRILEGDISFLEMVFNNEGDYILSSDSNSTVKAKTDLKSVNDLWLMADSMSCALCLSDADFSRKGSGGSLAGNVACLVAGCLQMRDNSKELNVHNPGHTKQHFNSKHQKDLAQEIVHPRACGLGRRSSVMLEYAPWVRDICQLEESKKLLGACRRRRAAHHFTFLAQTVVESFSSCLFAGCPPAM